MGPERRDRRRHSWRLRAHGEVFLGISGGTTHATIGHLTDKVTAALNSGDHRGHQGFSEDLGFLGFTI